MNNGLGIRVRFSYQFRPRGRTLWNCEYVNRLVPAYLVCPGKLFFSSIHCCWYWLQNETFHECFRLFHECFCCWVFLQICTHWLEYMWIHVIEDRIPLCYCYASALLQIVSLLHFIISTHQNGCDMLLHTGCHCNSVVSSHGCFLLSCLCCYLVL